MVVMNRVQIFMARQIGTWPLYTIVIALGQVRPLIIDPRPGAHVYSQDACRKQLPDDFAYWAKLPGQSPAICSQRCILSFIFRLVYDVPLEAFCLRPFCSLALLWHSILFDWPSLIVIKTSRDSHHLIGHCHLVICCCFCCCFHFLRFELWRGSG